MLDNEIVKFDSLIYLFVTSIKSDIFTTIFKNITMMGSAILLTSICVLSYFFIKNKKISICITINLIISGLLNYILKNIIRRNRPSGIRLVEETGFSFPSGHSMASMAFYGLIIYLIFKFVKNNPLKIIICTLLSILIILIGVSRIYLGVHYASDVLAGFMISVSYLVLFVHLIRNIIEDK